MIYGYLDTSLQKFGNESIDIDVRLKALKGLDKLISCEDSDKAELKRLCSSLKSGDSLMVNSFDALGRTPEETLSIIQLIQSAKATLVILDAGTISGYDSSIIKLLKAFLEFSHNAQIQSRRLGKDKARAKGKRVDGRPEKFKPEALEKAYVEWQYGELTQKEAAEKYGMSKSTLSRFAKTRRNKLDSELYDKYSKILKL